MGYRLYAASLMATTDIASSTEHIPGGFKVSNKSKNSHTVLTFWSASDDFAEKHAEAEARRILPGFDNYTTIVERLTDDTIITTYKMIQEDK